jgi:GNAT superfamily N-acetyltransferase
MSSYAIEILAKGHDRSGFVSGLESVDRYLWETARGHQEKGISVTRVMVKAEESPPKTVVGFFTLSNISVWASDWPGAPIRLPKQAVAAVLLGRLAVAKAAQNRGIGSMLMASARQLARETILLTGGVGLVVDAANEDVIGFYSRFGFRPVAAASLRMFLPAASLDTGARIQRDE